MRFCFYSGYRDLKGGYTTLLLTLITELRNQNKDVLLINYKAGLIEQELAKENITITIIDLDEISWKKIGEQISHDDIFIITAFDEIHKHLMRINPIVILYDINDFITRISNYKFNLKFPSLGKKLISELHANNSLWFMDDTGKFNLQNDFDLHISDPVFLPIPVIVPSENMYLAKMKDDAMPLRLTYIGRSVDWKMMPLKKILLDVLDARGSKEIMFNIVVDDAGAVDEFINLSAFNNIPGFKLNVIENMKPSAITNFLLEHSDLHFAMGTAALDAAKLGIPTIVMDYSPREFPDNYTYHWLFNVKEFSLGKNLLKRSSSPGMHMQELLGMMAGSTSVIGAFSSKSFEYVRRAHDVRNVVNKIIDLTPRAKFRLAQAKKYIPFYFKSHRIIKSIAGALYSRKPSQ